jgi:hypothetical protein
MHTDRCGNSCRQKCHAKGSRKKLRYKELCIEIQRMWKMKWKVIPVIIGATGIVTKSLKTNLEAIPGKHSTDALQETAVLVTSHIIRKLQHSETWSLSGGNHRWFVRSTRKKRPVTRDDNNNINNNKFGVSYCISQCLPFSFFNKATWNTKREMACLCLFFRHPQLKFGHFLLRDIYWCTSIHRTYLNNVRTREV